MYKFQQLDNALALSDFDEDVPSYMEIKYSKSMKLLCLSGVYGGKSIVFNAHMNLGGRQ